MLKEYEENNKQQKYKPFHIHLWLVLSPIINLGKNKENEIKWILCHLAQQIHLWILSILIGHSSNH